MEVLGAERDLHLGASATTLCNVRLFSYRMRSAESLLLNPQDPRYLWQIDNSLWVKAGGRLEPLRPLGLAAGLFPGLVVAVRYTSPNTIDAAGCDLLRDWGRCVPRT